MMLLTCQHCLSNDEHLLDQKIDKVICKSCGREVQVSQFAKKALAASKQVVRREREPPNRFTANPAISSKQKDSSLVRDSASQRPASEARKMAEEKAAKIRDALLAQADSEQVTIKKRTESAPRTAALFDSALTEDVFDDGADSED